MESYILPQNAGQHWHWGIEASREPSRTLAILAHVTMHRCQATEWPFQGKLSVICLEQHAWDDVIVDTVNMLV